ncbi:putative calcium uniporter protein [Helianthus annuus]|uniref:Calcium uniporter protein n=1 Tax=Helianthus annuus TaxID=4232 RepID=A0A251VE02_HELAN|nr:calcium uniporter protein 4, mitochondrial [Helianthus annuus]KAF5817853.1 putative calcium uniporter protein [Helianthus annuus]KAJ0604279.1 putative calcium uniporter protein [Helianthus annuus]KAJ0618287.1 putative calcium uniporter protein [Helianthus annuus]KAJ0776749.1 putative calcium uniporter protein [Helianthus annuus]KAJ0939327.1 putative calcium uniporter protein [Helianthus annuus]
MALRNAITKRLYKHLLPSSQKSLPNFHHHLFSSPETSSSTTDSIFFRKQTNRSPRFNQPDFFYIPVGEKLNISDCDPMTKNAPFGSGSGGLSVSDARKMVRCLQLQNVRSAVKMIQANSISYAEFVNVCMDTCGNRDQGVEFAKVLDVSGDVIVLGNVVFLRPDQIAKSMERVISQSMTMPNDPWKQELEELERQMALIDQKAISLVRCELYCGLGLLILQTLVFMRLTFWELSWDVMEPICFFVTSFHFALAYMFFLRTSKEPSFEGYFRQRFRVKRRKLMRTHKFDYKRYNELCNFVYPNYQGKLVFCN